MSGALWLALEVDPFLVGHDVYLLFNFYIVNYLL